MANTFYDPGAERSSRVRELFARIAPRYDLINDLQSFGLHRRWKKQVVKLAEPGPGRTALDVGCGTGDLALGMAARGAQVVGLDFSPPMLDIARRRAQMSAAGSTPGRVEFMTGDAQQLPFPENTFDIVTVGYGLRNLADWPLGLREMARVARPGGRLLVLDFGKPDNRLWRAIYFAYLRGFVPLLGLIFAGSADAYAYILESLKHYPAQRGVEAGMRDLGLTNVRIVSFLGGVMTINCGEKPSSSLPSSKASDQNQP